MNNTKTQQTEEYDLSTLAPAKQEKLSKALQWDMGLYGESHNIIRVVKARYNPQIDHWSFLSECADGSTVIYSLFASELKTAIASMQEVFDPEMAWEQMIKEIIQEFPEIKVRAIDQKRIIRVGELRMTIIIKPKEVLYCRKCFLTKGRGVYFVHEMDEVASSTQGMEWIKSLLRSDIWFELHGRQVYA